MEKRLSSFLALFIALFMSMNSYAQKEQQTLMLGDYETTDQMNAWDGFNLQNAPFIFAYGHSGSQVIYTAEQLEGMKDKEITSLSFKCFTYDDYSEAYTSNAKLYLQEIDGNEFPKSPSDNKSLNWVEFNKNNVIATAELNIDFLTAAINMEDVEITFDFSDKPYKYTGKSLVVTVVNDATGDYPQGTIQFYWIESQPSDPWRSLVYGSDKTDFLTNQDKDILLNGNEDKWKNAPIAKFTYQEADAPVDPTPTPTNGTVTLGHFDDQEQSAAWDGFNLQNAPVIMSYAHSGSQVIYTPEQLADMKGKQITSMAFKCFSNDCYTDGYTSNMKLYLQEVDAAEFYYDEVAEQYNWFKFDENDVTATLDFTADFLSAYGEDIEVKFDLSKKPFVYTGKTLVVTVVNDAPQCIDPSEGTIQFYWIDSTKGEPWKSFVFASDNITFYENQAKDNVLKTIDNEDKWKNAPAVQFTYEEASAPVPSDFSGGEGTEAAPYLISNVDDLAQLDEWANAEKTAGVYFKLTNDITGTPFNGMIASTGVFEGIFDGDNHCVEVNTQFPESNYVGFIGFMFGATVKNLQVSGNVTGNFYVGGVIGQAANGCTIENVINYATVNASMFAGGVIGQVITQNGFAGCVARQLANYGTVNSDYSGGVIGDMGQQVGNSIERIANYGHINGNDKSGGLISNARPYDSVYYGFNFGTTENEKPKGCLGNTKSSTIGELYYDAQMFNISEENAQQSGTTEYFIGSNFMSTEAGSGFSAEYWVYADNMYPRLKMNGMENLTIPVLYATPVILAHGNTLKKITLPFTVGTENGVEWSSKNGNIEFDGAVATPVNAGEDVITVTLDGVSRSINVLVDVNTGICDAIEEGSNTVKAVEGAVVMTLSDNADVQIIGISGSTVVNENLSAGTHTYAVPAGIYVVRIAGSTYKVCVK